MTWTLYEAQNLLKALVAPLKERGWGIALGGSVPVKGASDNDLDIVVFPLDKSCTPAYESFRDVLRETGLEPKWTAWEVQKFWARKGSSDTKHVEIWMLEDHRVDVFVLS